MTFFCAHLETEISTYLGPSADELFDDVIVLREHSDHERRAPIHGHLGVRMTIEQPLGKGAVPSFCRVVECAPKKGPARKQKVNDGFVAHPAGNLYCRDVGLSLRLGLIHVAPALIQ